METQAEVAQSGGTAERPAPRGRRAVRASDLERESAVQRLQSAFAEGRLDDVDFEQRTRAALTARTRADLDDVLTDLPANAGTPIPLPPPGRLAVAYKNAIRRGGRWRVPKRYTTVIYKGGCRLDLRAAELTAPVMTIRAVAYKSNIEIIVPPGVRVELGGVHVTRDSSDDDWEGELAHDAPVVHIRGFAYKGTIEARTTLARR